MTDGRVLGHDGVGVLALLAPPSVIAGPTLGGSPARLVVHVRKAIGKAIPWQGAPPWLCRQPSSPGVSPPGRRHPRPLSSTFGEGTLEARRDRLLADGTWASTMSGPTTRSARSEWEWLRRLVGLSGLGWAFVLTAVCWELFAVALSLCAGWGWDRGAGFFAWGLGILALGFYMRTSRERPAVSRLFLGVNLLVVGVLSLVVATR